MAERRSEVGISNREAPEEEARERRNLPPQVEGEAAAPDDHEAVNPDSQTSSKSGTKASAQKSDSTRHTDGTAPASSKVQGAFGKEG